MQNMYLSTRNPTLKMMLALRFLRAFSRINRSSCSSPSSSYSSSIVRRSRQFKLAAYDSMAYAAGAKRAWSRALLHKLQRRARLRRSVRMPKLFVTKMNKRKVSSSSSGGGAGQVMSGSDKLRHLLPGGKGMDFCSLLDETANYIQCLTAQVQVMQGIADSLAP